MGHFAQDCSKLNKVQTYTDSFIVYVCSHVFVAHIISSWIVDIRAIKHVVGIQIGYIDYQGLPASIHYVTICNGTYVDVLEVGTYRLRMCIGLNPLLYDVFYAVKIHCNLLSVLAMLPLCFSFHLKGTQMDNYLVRKFFWLGKLGKYFFHIGFGLAF